MIFLAKSDRDVAEIELIAPLGEDSPIQSTLAKSGGGAYHLCFETSELDGCVGTRQDRTAASWSLPRFLPRHFRVEGLHGSTPARGNCSSW